MPSYLHLWLGESQPASYLSSAFEFIHEMDRIGLNGSYSNANGNGISVAAVAAVVAATVVLVVIQRISGQQNIIAQSENAL